MSHHHVDSTELAATRHNLGNTRVPFTNPHRPLSYTQHNKDLQVAVAGSKFFETNPF